MIVVGSVLIESLGLFKILIALYAMLMEVAEPVKGLIGLLLLLRLSQIIGPSVKLVSKFRLSLLSWVSITLKYFTYPSQSMLLLLNSGLLVIVHCSLQIWLDANAFLIYSAKSHHCLGISQAYTFFVQLYSFKHISFIRDGLSKHE